MAKILVTGHLGFIGSHLFKALKEKGHEVEGIDLKDEDNPNNDIRALTPSDLFKVDYVFHLAAKAKVPYSVDNPLESHDHNINGTLNVLRCAKEAGVKRVIYSASSSAYGDQDSLPLKEDMTPNPLSPYAIQKLVGEYYCRVYSQIYNLETVSLRYFNVYGEGMPLDGPYSAAIAIFRAAKAKDEELPVMGGKQTRDFTFVEDVVNANILAMESDLVGKGEVINIGGGQNYSIEEVAKAISEKIKYLLQRKGEPMHTLADISKAKELLGWSPTTNLLQWLKSQ